MDPETVKQRRSRKRRAPGKRLRTQLASQPAELSQTLPIGEFTSASNLAWRSVAAPSGIVHGDDELGGFLCLEEVDDVMCSWEGNDDTGKVCRFKPMSETAVVAAGAAAEARPHIPFTEEEMAGFIHIDDFVEPAVNEVEKQPTKHKAVSAPHASDATDTATSKQKPKHVATDAHSRTSEEEVSDTDVSAWRRLGLDEPILNALARLGYSTPTAIQAETLPHALERKDIVGAAETGSGKTLAFGLPILQYLAKLSDIDMRDNRGLAALILTPTRELAIQVKDHIAAAAQCMNVKIAVVVGGMSIQKQERLLQQHPDILVATPGRLWEIMSENDAYAAHIRKLRFLVLDEADRMLEAGRFKELEFILSAISRKHGVNEWKAPDIAQTSSDKKLPPRRQTFVFSATLGHDLRLGGRRVGSTDAAAERKKRKASTDNGPSLQELMDRLEFDSTTPAVVDVTRKGAVAERLVEVRIDCLKDDKDLYLYYFLCRYPGRTLVFVNSIDCLRRILPLLKLLRVNVYGLHAQMQQRQRLKNVDRFKADARAVLVASDVAARGLDIPLVEHVIHYQLPRSGEIYVHRSGRTARAGREGISAMLCSPEEMPSYRKLCQVLQKPNGVPEFPVDQIIVAELKKRLQLARQIDKVEHRAQKNRHDDDWMIKHAEALEIELDERKAPELPEVQERDVALVQKLKQQLNHALTKSLIPAGSSARYLTSGIVRDLAERLLSASASDTLPAMDKSSAIHDAKIPRSKRRRTVTKQ